MTVSSVLSLLPVEHFAISAKRLPDIPNTNLGRAMKNFLAAAITLLVASTIFIGCGFVDDNPGATPYEEEQTIQTTYIGYGTAGIDTTGYEGGD